MSSSASEATATSGASTSAGLMKPHHVSGGAGPPRCPAARASCAPSPPGHGGSTWFARYEGGALVTPINGALGWVDTAGTVHSVNTGSRHRADRPGHGPGRHHLVHQCRRRGRHRPHQSGRHRRAHRAARLQPAAPDRPHRRHHRGHGPGPQRGPGRLPHDPPDAPTWTRAPGRSSTSPRPSSRAPTRAGRSRCGSGTARSPSRSPAPRRATAGCAGTAVLTARKGKHPAVTKVGSYALAVGAVGQGEAQAVQEGSQRHCLGAARPSSASSSTSRAAPSRLVVETVKVRR